MKAFPSASFTQAYGMTELAPVATMLSPADHEAGRLRAAGRAAPHAEVRVVGPDDLDEQGYLYVVDQLKDMIVSENAPAAGRATGRFRAPA
jgi:acyl-CoA synthetase (AMP-forming)/AMP-acid ligase II